MRAERVAFVRGFARGFREFEEEELGRRLEGPGRRDRRTGATPLQAPPIVREKPCGEPASQRPQSIEAA